MTPPLLFTLPGQEDGASAFARAARLDRGDAEIHPFPDGETYVRVATPCAGRDAVVYAVLDRPDAKLAPLLLLAATLRDLGAARIALVAPYLPYLRQDRRFKEGEGVTSRYFARVLSAHFDLVLTVDPHLHRYRSLSAVYSVPGAALHADAALAGWIRANVESPVLVGPDRESAGRVATLAKRIGAPFVVLAKVRRGDRSVAVRLPAGAAPDGRTPVLVDDVISTGHTLAAAARELRAGGFDAPLCVAVHGLFCGDAAQVLRDSGITRVVTANTVPHASNAIDVQPLLAEGLAALMKPRRRAAARPARGRVA